MENFNKVLSFILGFVVVVVFMIVLSSRLNLKDKFLPFASPAPTKPQEKTQTKGGASLPEPTRIVLRGATPTPVYTMNNYNKKLDKVSKIPSTGVETALLPTLATLLSLGFYVRKKAK